MSALEGSQEFVDDLDVSSDSTDSFDIVDSDIEPSTQPEDVKKDVSLPNAEELESSAVKSLIQALYTDSTVTEPEDATVDNTESNLEGSTLSPVEALKKQVHANLEDAIASIEKSREIIEAYMKEHPQNEDDCIAFDVDFCQLAVKAGLVAALITTFAVLNIAFGSPLVAFSLIAVFFVMFAGEIDEHSTELGWGLRSQFFKEESNAESPVSSAS